MCVFCLFLVHRCVLFFVVGCRLFVVRCVLCVVVFLFNWLLFVVSCVLFDACCLCFCYLRLVVGCGLVVVGR